MPLSPPIRFCGLPGYLAIGGEPFGPGGVPQ
jgi:hypothetical protein